MEKGVASNCSDKIFEVPQKYQDFRSNDSGTERHRTKFSFRRECDDVSFIYLQKSLVVRQNIRNLPIANLSALECPYPTQWLLSPVFIRTSE